MGPDWKTAHQLEADAFFAQFIDAPEDVIARVASEATRSTGPDLDSIVAESAAFNYWNRHTAAQDARRATKERAEAVKQVAAATRWAHPKEAARIAPLAPESLALLPAHRVVRMTDKERLHTAQYWRWLAGLTSGRYVVARFEREAREYERRQRWLATKAAKRLWRREQREFERQQWLDARTAGDEFWARMQEEEQEQQWRQEFEEQQQEAHEDDFGQGGKEEQEQRNEPAPQAPEPAAAEEEVQQATERDEPELTGEQRAFAETLWLQTRRGQREYWQRRKRALRWVAISEERALEIALAAFDALPPQDRTWS